MINKRELSRLKRHKRIRVRTKYSSQRPRLSVHRSLKNLCAQIVDDIAGKTLLSMSTQDKQIKQKFPSGGNVLAAVYFGEVFAAKAKEKGITKVSFDRAGYLYHGRIKSFAESLRKQGLEF